MIPAEESLEMDSPREEKIEESSLSERLEQAIQIEPIPQVPALDDLSKLVSQDGPTTTQSTNEEYGTPNPELMADQSIDQEDILTSGIPDSFFDDIAELADKSGNLVESIEQITRPTIATDNGIFDFMTPDEAIELYKKIHASGPPELDWKFYGRRKPGDERLESGQDVSIDKNETNENEQSQNQTVNTEFDFDEDLGLEPETCLINESLQLKKRFEPGNERKTNLSDIMSDIRKESHIDNQ